MTHMDADKGCAPTSRAKLPNIIFIITDQQRYDTIAAAGFPYMITPHLDRLVREGVSFANMFVTSPSCAPSRASLFTGVYPHTNGVLRNDDRWTWSWVTLLARAGYRCANIGKMHTFPFEESFGFHERHVTENKDRAHPLLPSYLDNWDKALWAHGHEKPGRLTYRSREDYAERLGTFDWELPEKLHPDNFVGDFARHWIETYKRNEPFFLQIGFPGPHPPYDPTRDASELYREADLPLPVCDQQDRASQPQVLKDLRRAHMESDHDAVVHLDAPTEEQLRRQRQYYFANVTMIDAQVGRLLEALEARSLADDTVVIFTSDHGDCLNDHGHSQKWTMYEQSVHVPGIIWAPARLRGGRTVDGLVSLMDLGPTVLEMAGVSVPEWMEARSLLPLALGDTDGRSRVFAEHARDMILASTAFMTMVRDECWKLVHFVDSDEGQLFDLAADPGEFTSLWDSADHQDIKRRMIDAILKWRIESAIATQGWHLRG